MIIFYADYLTRYRQTRKNDMLFIRLLLAIVGSTFISLAMAFMTANSITDSSSTSTHRSSNLFDWRAASLFPVSAIISLTNDNSTFFLARPATFGSSLPPDGFNGRLWVGSGIGVGSFGGDAASNVTSNLGCSDVLESTSLNKVSPGYAEIISSQENEEVAGRVVLLGRGGCSFLEKAKWVQRRGGTALIVGDNLRGGPLISMFAQGDASNITIPAIFTSYTSAQLLAALASDSQSSITDSSTRAKLTTFADNAVDVKSTTDNGKVISKTVDTALDIDTVAENTQQDFSSPSSKRLAFLRYSLARYIDRNAAASTVKSTTTTSSIATMHVDEFIDGSFPKTDSAISNPPIKINIPTLSSATTLQSQISTTNASDPANTTHTEGLWVTLQPVNLSPSPFLGALLVLVISPLATLSIVYALLLIRSQVRRRRWRAPKSIVERFPVRTYYTIASPASTIHIPSTVTSANVSTPLLISSRRSLVSQSGVQNAIALPKSVSAIPNSSSHNSNHFQLQEKIEGGMSSWQRKYGGRQRECVVCLEDYLDGVSRVMSLPCGHEFHEECM